MTRRRFSRIRMAVLAILAMIVAAVLALYFMPLPVPLSPSDRLESTKILDRDGRLIYDTGDVQGNRHSFVTFKEIPERLKQAVVATEDASFFSHTGIDPVAIGRAALDDAVHLSIRSGGSTITQQLARNLYFDAEQRTSRDPRRKLLESYHALRLERAWSKEQILEAYLNRCYFGNLAYGLGAASQVYFGKQAKDLDLAESAFLTGLLQSPLDYDPFLHFDAAKARQADVLRLMVEAGYLDQVESAAAFDEPLVLNRTPFPIEAPHFVAWVMEQLPGLIGADAVAAGNLRVHTSLDLPLQAAAEASLAWQIEGLRDRNVTTGAVVALDPETGHVLAMAGSADYFDLERSGNVNAALALRQPGSAIKPVVYAAALEQGYTPASPLLDIPTSVHTRQGEVYAPQNYDLTFHGVVPLREALASSYNVPAVRLLDAISVEVAFRLGQAMGLTTFIDPEAYDLSLTLGGGEVRALDLTAAYAALAAGGLRVDPVAIIRVEDGSGYVLYEAPTPQRPRILSPETAYLITDILSDNTARAPSFGTNSALALAFPAAAKTGTTTDFRDNWTVGYSPTLAVGVWVGNADGSSMRNVSGIDGAAPVWRDVMNAGHKGVPERAFLPPAGIEHVVVCLPSGLLPTADCQRQRDEVFAAGTAPTRSDDYYQRLSGCPAQMACDGRVYAFVPVEAIPWAREAGLDLPPVAPYISQPYSGDAHKETVESRLRLVSPADGLVLSLSREIPLGDQRLPLEVLPSGAVQFVELRVNGQRLVRLDAAPYRFVWPLQEGNYSFEASAIDFSGNELRSAPMRLQVLAP